MSFTHIRWHVRASQELWDTLYGKKSDTFYNEMYCKQHILFRQIKTLKPMTILGISYVTGDCVHMVQQQPPATSCERHSLYYPVNDECVEDTAAAVSSRGFHEGKSQISNQLTAAWQCGRMWGMCWSHVARAPDLTPPTTHHSTPPHPTPASTTVLLF